MEVSIVKDMMGIAWNNELYSKGHINITHFMEKVHMLSIFLHGIFDEGWCESSSAQQNPQDFNSFRWGGKLRWGVEV
jgi:hypothetical protein